MSIVSYFMPSSNPNRTRTQSTIQNPLCTVLVENECAASAYGLADFCSATLVQALVGHGMCVGAILCANGPTEDMELHMSCIGKIKPCVPLSSVFIQQQPGPSPNRSVL